MADIFWVFKLVVAFLGLRTTPQNDAGGLEGNALAAPPKKRKGMNSKARRAAERAKRARGNHRRASVAERPPPMRIDRKPFSEDEKHVAKAGGTASGINEGTLFAMLPLDAIVRAERPDLDPTHVKRVIIAFIAPGRRWSYFGDRPLPYQKFQKLVAGVPTEALNQCFEWLIKIRVVVDVNGGRATDRKRGRDHRRCALNMKSKDAPPPGDEIIKLAQRARDKLDRLSRNG